MKKNIPKANPNSWISKERFCFEQIREFHLERARSIVADNSDLLDLSFGGLLIHLVPQTCVFEWHQFDFEKLLNAGRNIPPLGFRSGSESINSKGVKLYMGGSDVLTGYSQIYRDGRIEGFHGDLRYDQQNVSLLRIVQCEQAIVGIIPVATEFYQAIEIDEPVWLFSALLRCEGSRPQRFWRRESPIVEQIHQLPEVRFNFDVDSQQKATKAWCDFLWQSFGSDKSPNYDTAGKWTPPSH